MIVLSEYRAPTETLRRTDALDGAGAVHIDRIVREVIAGVPGRPAAIRLAAAAWLASVLDGRDADRDYAEYVDEQNGMSADPWGIGLAAITLPDWDCETCHDTGEVGDGYTREYETGMWVTWPCPDCTYPTRTPDDH